jgi:hypothetical protein
MRGAQRERCGMSPTNDFARTTPRIDVYFAGEN